MAEQVDSTTVFSDKAANYVVYRPGYPEGLTAFLRDDVGINPGSKVADIGSGTGKFSAQLLSAGYYGQLTGRGSDD